MAEVAVTVSETEERELRRRAAQYTRPHREVIRAKVVLLAAEGHSDCEIARRLDCTDKTAGKWRRRFAEEGLAGLDERRRPGRPRSFPPAEIAEVRSLPNQARRPRRAPSTPSAHPPPSHEATAASRTPGLGHNR
jgi:hypothetical protein